MLRIRAHVRLINALDSEDLNHLVAHFRPQKNITKEPFPSHGTCVLFIGHDLHLQSLNAWH